MKYRLLRALPVFVIGQAHIKVLFSWNSFSLFFFNPMSKADSACIGDLIIPDGAWFSLFVSNLLKLTYCFLKRRNRERGRKVTNKC